MSKRASNTLWDLAIEKAIRRDDDDDGKKTTNLSSVVLIGSRHSGKTSMILRFLDREEAPKPTTALEYTFGRRSKGHNIAKDVGHIWELGGGVRLSRLLELPFSAEYILSTSVVLFLDLSTPDELWLTLDSFLTSIRKLTDPRQLSDQDMIAKFAHMRDLKSNSHADKDSMNLLPIPIVFIGSKYDLFQEMEPEKRKVICKTLRFVAHHCGASVQFFSTKHESLLNKAKVTISHLLFGTLPSKTLQLDHNKPLLIPFGMDSLQQIGSPPSTGRGTEHFGKNLFDSWRDAYLDHFPQTTGDNPSEAEDPAADQQYKEVTIDDLRMQKAEELERYKKVSGRNFADASRSLQNEAY